MELLLVWALLIALIVLIWQLRQARKELRQIDQRLRVIASLTRDTRSSQGSIGTRRTNGTAPEKLRPRMTGHRTDVPATGRMRDGLKFERKGGEYERNRDTDGD